MNILISILLIFVSLSYHVIIPAISGKDNKSVNDKNDKVLAFPGAEGAGKFVTGGREGPVIYVTNLNDSGTGSLREAITTKGSRTIVFGISGCIFLKSEMEINHGDITIAGQSAPTEGITICGYPLILDADNIIIRYLRIRTGDTAKMALDAISCINHKNIIVDHCSFSWAVDEVASFYDNENFTLQWCIISESLNSSWHPKGEHGYGGIWGGINATFHHNLLMHHTSRNPRLQGSRNHGRPGDEKASLINNVVYNWQSKCIYGGEQGNYNIIGNYFIPGPATKKSDMTNILEPFRQYGKFYFADNAVDENRDITENNRSGIRIPQENINDILYADHIDGPHFIKPESASTAYTAVLRSAGASLFRDKIDNRLISEVAGRTYSYGNKGIINSQDDAGGWPEYKNANGMPDADKDGMPDKWEQENHLDMSNPSDNNIYSMDKHMTNLEVYLNSIVKNNLIVEK